jgi:hypothetical protein
METSKQFGVLLNMEYKARNEVVREQVDGVDRKRLMKYGHVRRTQDIRLRHKTLEWSPERRCKGANRNESGIRKQADCLRKMQNIVKDRNLRQKAKSLGDT